MTTPSTPPAPQAPYQQAAPQQAYQQQPQGFYTSPIPVRPATLGDAIASEWTKIRSVRSTMWTLGVMTALLLVIGVLTAVAVSASDSDMNGTPVLSLGFFGVLLSTICVITLGVMTIASEYGTGMIRTTLTACPSRGRVLGAKALVFFLLTFVLTTVMTSLVALIQSSMLDAASPTGGEWLRATVGVSLYVATLGLLALAVGALIRHSAGSITIMIGVVLLPLVLALFMFASSLEGLRDALLEYSVPNQLSVFYDNSVSTSGPSGWDPLWIMIGVTAVAMGGAFLSMNQRDV
ncbi:ABC-type transport system involved in multi-copper enzyme maturation permease subunit [Streptomyces sp. KhCrAH-43]|uniref:ABC transporter permease n=1 Tax=Streptomyces TaxID=1883 RepID=UPI00036B027C|nr:MULTISPECIES: ABC transporter permease [unclassified Streptomyces]MYS37924.1 ABC transporter permease subunit [Streptomyces sp. SID4920]MYX66111.1 ABC transporter permease subunit [Streptomyces sp. SID8373]RAJ67595.1 ABC-type transport system involved in multi-copper enzyme maturation permease subunit [Streptomyces sp. KhCrAH-43]